MISSGEILEATGLRSAKTLTRWHQRGLIPAPTIGTHPSGRGKMSFWPDWVLDRCLQIVELQKAGHSLHSAAHTLEMQRIERLIEDAKEDPTHVLDKVTVRVGDQTITALEAFTLEVMGTLGSVVPAGAAGRELYQRLKADRVVAQAMNLLEAGYNPVALFDGEAVNLVPDFVVSHRLSDTTAKPVLVVPLLPALRKAVARFGTELNIEPKAMAAPEIWVRRENETVSYAIYVGGPLGFELIKETEKVVGVP